MRLPAPFGQRIDRSQTLEFTFADKRFSGYVGDTVASALLASGARTLSRSFKYHRRRGALTFAGVDGNTLVQIGSRPNQRADIEPVAAGMAADAQNVFGRLELDAAELLDLCGGFLPVGFYYRAFYKPRGAWKRWEPVIRRMAGLGRVDTSAPHRIADIEQAYADVAVIGAGPAGLRAALTLAEAGLEVWLVDREPELGGSATWRRGGSSSGHATDVAGAVIEENQVAALVCAVAAHPKIAVCTRTTCTGWFAENELTLMGPKHYTRLCARAVVLASGELDQPAVFRNNDLPGILLGSGVQRLLRHYGVRPGQTACVLTADRRGYEVALDLHDAGARVARVIDTRQEVDEADLNALAAKGIAVEIAHTVHQANRNWQGELRAVEIGRFDAAGHPRGASSRIPCDLLAVSAGAIPQAQLVCHAGGSLEFEPGTAQLRVVWNGTAHNAWLAGAVDGAQTLDEAFASAEVAGRCVLRALQGEAGPGEGAIMAAVGGSVVDGVSGVGGQRAAASPAVAMPVPEQAPEELPGAVFEQAPEGLLRGSLGPTIFPHPKGRDFIDFDEDIQVKDIARAIALGYRDPDLVKRFSTVVMGQSQGKQSALNNLKVQAQVKGQMLADLKLTTQRPPFFPEPVRLLAGRTFDPVRRSSLHALHVEAGAQMMVAGVWMRPAWYGPADARAVSIAREVAQVRNAVGMIDVSTLGKIDVRGPDAVTFLNRLYTGNLATLAEGRTRYIVSLDDTGAIVDDGVAFRIGPEKLYLTATTSAVDAVYRQMLKRKIEWGLDVTVTQLTGTFAAINVAGPGSRQVMMRLAGTIDFGAEAFPYLAWRGGHLDGVPVRIARVGFVGELGYEIHLPAGAAPQLWRALLEVGAEFGLTPFGVEAQRVLRLEKGHIIVGQDTDGLTIPAHANMGWVVSRKKTDSFIGAQALLAIEARGLDRVLVGFRIEGNINPPDQNNLVIRNGDIVGRVTSVAKSDTLGCIVGLAYVALDQNVPGTRFIVRRSDGRYVEAEVVPPPFYDPEALRQQV